MIRIQRLSKIYRTEQVETVALKEINLEIDNGEFISIMGPSGCGKSTLLNILGLLDCPQQGSYAFGQKELTALSEKQQSQFRKENIGIIFQNFNLINRLTVFDNIALPLLYAKVSVEERDLKTKEMLRRMNLEQRAHHYPQQLSGGQRQRVAIARALINNPRLVLADEPTGNLDRMHGNEVMELISEMSDAGTTVVMVTHSLHDASFGKRIIYMLDGHIVTQKFNKPSAVSLL